jgi:uroporphyrinogen decarboxylase
VDLAVEVTLLPERVLGVDALILFSDILVPLQPLGVKVEFTPKPVLTSPPIEELKEFDPSAVEFVFETVRRVKQKSDLPLIGFAGAPFTLGAYIVEGQTSREFLKIRKLYHSDRERFHLLMEKLTEMTEEYLSLQISAGADAVQLFDSWAFVLSPSAFKEYSIHLQRLFTNLKRKHPRVPLIYFFRGSGHLFELAKELPVDALSVDWTLDIEKPLRELPDKAFQGNLDPALLYADRGAIERAVKNFLQKVAEYRKTLYVFNLGHGLSPDMEEEKVKFLVEVVKSFGL